MSECTGHRVYRVQGVPPCSVLCNEEPHVSHEPLCILLLKKYLICYEEKLLNFYYPDDSIISQYNQIKIMIKLGFIFLLPLLLTLLKRLICRLVERCSAEQGRISELIRVSQWKHRFSFFCCCCFDFLICVKSSKV